MVETPTICFLADVHISQERPDIFLRFQEFSNDILRKVSHLYILGDLFDFWVGDDAAEPLGFNAVSQLLHKISNHGVEIYIQRGNRDFLLGNDFAALSGATLLNDPVTLKLGNDKALLSHGDIWCTDDAAYMQFRELVHNPDWQREQMAKSIPERIALAKELRLQSEMATADKKHNIMDVNPDAVKADAVKHDCNVLIHGHTHRPAVHHEDDYTRYVLGDWFDQDSWIIWQDGQFTVNSDPQT